MRRTRSICLAISATLLLAASPSAARTRPHYGGVLRLQTRASALESDQLRSLVAESLTSLDEQGQVHPLLADRWESQNGGRKWQFSIHPHVSMHDETPVTGTLVAQVLTANRAVVPWHRVQGTESTVTFECDSPIPNLPALLASGDFAVVKRNDDGVPIGTGPFRVASAAGTNANLEANSNYWGGRAYVDRVEYVGSRAVRSQLLDLGVGRSDVVEVPGEFLRRAQQDHLRLTDSAVSELVLVAIAPSITDSNLRRAISLSIDRTALANVIFQRQGQAAFAFLPNTMTGYGMLFPPAFDVAQARDLRSRTSYIPVLTVGYDAADPTMQLAAERIALNARDIGITMQAIPQNQSSAPTLRLLRVPLPSSDPAACLSELLRDVAGENLATTNDLGVLYQQEREQLEKSQLIPLVHLPAAVATSERVRDREELRAPRGVADVWIEERR